jgi:hypothetical protein
LYRRCTSQRRILSTEEDITEEGAELPVINIAAATALVLNGPGKSSPHIGL